ncbi:MAG: hypothetical protein OXG82_03165 [Gammaproteobacteria bacterium]|nr:hypothetical protein [Gammaproteobacteria bacterium]
MNVPDADDWLTTAQIWNRTFELDDNHTHAVTRALVQRMESDGTLYHEGHSWQRTDAGFE